MIFHSDPIVEITLPVNLQTQNTGRGNAWYGTAAKRLAYERQLCHEFRREPFEFPVAVLYTRILGPDLVKQKPWDNDNLAMALKQLQDTLVALGWFVDDGVDWLKLIGYRHETERREDGPAVMVSVWRVSE